MLTLSTTQSTAETGGNYISLAGIWLSTVVDKIKICPDDGSG